MALYQNEVNQRRSQILSEVSYDYSDAYPEGMDLRPGKAGENKHDKFVTMVKDRALLSYRRMSKRHPEFEEIEKTLNVYIPADEEEKRVKANVRKDSKS